MANLNKSDIIFLIYLTNYNISYIYELINKYYDRDTLIRHLIKEKGISQKDLDKAISDTNLCMDKLDYFGIDTISVFDHNYPTNLKFISDSPPMLFVKGKFKTSRLAAVVGSRDTSKYAIKITRQVIQWLDEKRYSVVSGLADGIDSLAHKFANDKNIYNIAVLPNSLDSIYPKHNYGLANKILEKDGCLISELAFNINRGKKSFVQRNRIQAALASVVIPIEMGSKSGTMHTINFARRYDKRILVMEPTKMLMNLNQYSGINEIIKKYGNSILKFTDEDSFKKVIDSDPPNKEKQAKIVFE